VCQTLHILWWQGTKSLIPLSPTGDSGTSEQHFVDDQDEKAVKCDVPEKPLVIL